MMRIGVIAAVLLLALGGIARAAAPLAAACAPIRAAHPALAGQDLTIGLGGYSEGFEMPSAQDPARIVGLDPDLFDAVDACLGTRHHFIVTSFSILIASIGSGRVAVGPLLYETPERGKRVDFVSAMRVIDGELLRRHGDLAPGLDALCGHVVGAAAGTYEAVTLLPGRSAACVAARHAGIDMLLLQSTDAALQALLAGRVDAIFIARPQAQAEAASDPRLALGATLDLPIVAGYPIAKGRADLAAALLAAMRAIQGAGIERAALARWGMGADAEQPAALLD